jgi:hypothetical protein
MKRTRVWLSQFWLSNKKDSERRDPETKFSDPSLCERRFSAVRHANKAVLPTFLGIAPAPILFLTTFRTLAAAVLPALFLFRTSRDEVYNILWALVFGFATINILSLGARRFEENKAGMNFGEVLAVLVVLVSVVLLGWEMLYVFGVLPLRLRPS